MRSVAFVVAALAVALLDAGGPAAGPPAAKPAKTRPATPSPEVHDLAVAAGTRLLIRGVRGEIDARLGKPGELRWAVRTLEGGTPNPELAAASVDAGTRIGPASGAAPVACRLELALPPGVGFDVEADGAKVTASGLKSTVSVKGSGMNVDARGVEGRVTIALRAGQVKLSSLTGDVEVDGNEIAVEGATVTGNVRASVEGGKLVLKGVRGDVDAGVNGAPFTGEGITGSLTLNARNSKVDVSALGGGGSIEVREASLKLSRASAGEIEILSDGDVEIGESGASIRVDARGGSIKAMALKAPFEVRGGVDTKVAVASAAEVVRVDGDGLKVLLREIQKGAEVRSSRSEVTVDGAGGPVTIDNRDGPITVTRARDRVTVRSSGGDVKLTALQGAADVDAEGPRVQVLWGALPQAEDSTIRNAGGLVDVGLQGPGGIGVEARSRSGEVRSTLPGVVVSGDGRSADGRIGTGTGRATIRIEGEGDVQIHGTAPSPAAQAPPPPAAGGEKPPDDPAR